MKRFRGGLVFKARRLLYLNSRLESNEYEEKEESRSAVGASRGGTPETRNSSSSLLLSIPELSGAQVYEA